MLQRFRAHMNLMPIGVYLAVFVAMLDQGSKWLILNNILAEKSSVYVTPFMNFTLSKNTGVTFGLFSDIAEWMPYVLMGVTLLIAVFLLNWLRKVGTLCEALGLGLILGGAVGNVIDRFQHGAVIDFIDVHWMGYHWYTFNIADSAIVMGVCLLLLESMLESRQNGNS